MGISLPYVLNRNESCIILSPDFLSMAKEIIETDKFIGSGMFVDRTGAPCTIEKAKKWFGLVTETNYYNGMGGKVLKPSGNVEAYFDAMSVLSKVFTDDPDAPIAAGDQLTIIDGRLAKTDDNHTIPVFEVMERDGDMLKVASI